MQTHMVAMRDGIRLATDIYLPPGAHPGDRFPVIVERTPYGRADISGSEVAPDRPTPLRRDELAQIMARRGYAVVMQDVRGRGGSGGVFDKYVCEAEDGVDSFDWILAQDWCDGRICTMGLSYGAHTQLAAAVGGARGIAAMAIDTGGLMDLWRHSLRLGGAFELKQVTWAFRHAARALRQAGNETAAARIEATDIRAAILTGDWRPGASPLAAAPAYEATLLKMWQMRADDPDLRTPATHAAAYMDRFPDVPVLIVGSWFDPYATNMSEMAAALRSRQTAPMRQIMGPWLHGKRSTGWVGGADFGPAATIDAATGRDWITLRLDWFDHALGRGDNPLPHDLFFCMSPSVTSSWPQMGGRWLPALPASDPLPLRGPHAITLHFDPDRPFPTLGGGITSGGAMMAGGMFDHRATLSDLGDRATILRSGPLSAPISLSGALRLTVEVAQIAPPGPADVSAVVLIACPDGAIVNVTDGYARLAPHDRATTIDCLSTCFCVPEGAEVMVVLSTANFPRLDLARKAPYRLTGRLTC